jgi:hypothetical protein
MFSLGNTTSPLQSVQTFLYPFDNTPSMDFLLPSAGGGGGGDTSCKVHGGGAIAAQSGEGKFNLDVHSSLKGSVSYRGDGHDYNSTVIVSLQCTSSTTATIRSNGFDGNTPVTDVVVNVKDGGEKSSSDTFSISGLTNGYSRSGSLTKGNIQVFQK